MPGGGPIERLEDRMAAALDKHRADTDADLRQLRQDAAEDRKRINVLERWQSWVYGVAAGTAVLAGVLAKGVAKKLGFD